MWRTGVPLAEIAQSLNYSFSTLAKLRITCGLQKRFGYPDDKSPPTPEMIRIRCMEQQTNWTPNERRLRWQGVPHTIYSSITAYDEPQ